MTNIYDEEKLLNAVAILNAKVLGIILGITFGLIIFIITIWLVIKGPQLSPSGEYVLGPHLQLLSQFFIGYTVFYLGSIVGFIYGFAIGTILGTLIGWIYNSIVELRQRN